jgi:dTDP-4-amino-4,6-dideoxygalactose transaminase
MIAERLGVDPLQVVAASSATAALWAACKVLQVESPRVCPLTWPSTYSGVDGYPKWLDYGAEVEYREIAVDLWGIPYDLNQGIPTILDAAHRFGDPKHGKMLRVGATQAIVYSFAPQKEVPSPDGGVVVCFGVGLADAIRVVLGGNLVMRRWAGLPGGGIKGLMSDVAAALVREGINQHDKRRERRRQVLAWYERHLGKLVLTRRAEEASGHMCVVRAPSEVVRDHWRRVLTSAGIAWGHHYPLNKEQTMQCPVAAEVSSEIITLPCHVKMDAAAVRRVCVRILSA